MKIAPLAWNLITGATITNAAAAFERAWPAANLVDPDPHLFARWRGGYTVTAGVDDKIDGNDGAVFAATLTAGTYHSAMEYAVMVAARLNAVSTNWRAPWLQNGANRFRWNLLRTSGTATLLNASGANAATSAAVLRMGFRAQDRAAAASHVADVATCHGKHDSLTVDTGSTTTVPRLVAWVAPKVSPAAVFSLGLGIAAAADDETFVAGDAADDEIVALLITPANALRYAELRITDPRRTSHPRTGLGYAYLGYYFDTDNVEAHDRVDFELDSFRRSTEVQYPRRVGKYGHFHAAEVRPGVRFSVAFSGSPGLSSGLAPEVEQLLHSLGTTGHALVMFDSSTNPHRYTRMCRLTQAPSLQRAAAQDRAGRWRVSLSFEVVPVL